MNKYLIRLDDACPTMDAQKWSRIEAILNQGGGKAYGRCYPGK